MRRSHRYFIIADDGTIRRLAIRRFYDILVQRAPAPFPDLVGRRVRFAQILVHLRDGKPVAVDRARYGYLTFDNHGIFDTTEWDKAMRRTIESWPSPTGPEDRTVLDARARFAEQRHAHEHEWQPTDDMRRKLFAKATGSRQPYTEDKPAPRRR